MSHHIDPSQQEISQRAFALWEERGKPEGQESNLWLEAESDLQRLAAHADADAVHNSHSADTAPSFPYEKPRRSSRANPERGPKSSGRGGAVM